MDIVGSSKLQSHFIRGAMVRAIIQYFANRIGNRKEYETLPERDIWQKLIDISRVQWAVNL